MNGLMRLVSTQYLLLLAVLLGTACNSAIEADPGGDGGFQELSRDAAFDGGVPDSGDASLRRDAGPEADSGDSLDAGGQVTDAWIPLPHPVGHCPYMVPSGSTVMPEAIAWDDCPPFPEGYQCRVMRIDWSDYLPFTYYYSTKAAIDPATGTPLVAFTKRNASNPSGGTPGNLFVVAEVDGRVRNAVFLKRSDCLDCEPLTYFDLADGLFSLDLEVGSTCDPAPSHEIHSFVQKVSDPIGPPMLRNSGNRAGSHRTHVSSRWIIDRMVNRGYTAINRATNERFEIFGPGQDPDGLIPAEIVTKGDAAFFLVANGGNTGVMSWNPVAGTRPLLRWYGDFSRGASNFATDGEHMVWTQGEGKPPGGGYGDFTSVWIMTAPFTTDPEELKTTARRLRTDPNRWVIGLQATFATGCGLAAHALGGSNGLLIVRLADGYSWHLTSQPDFRWDQALAITCEEVFALAGKSIARVRLDSLGEPVPPDVAPVSE